MRQCGKCQECLQINFLGKIISKQSDRTIQYSFYTHCNQGRISHLVSSDDKYLIPKVDCSSRMINTQQDSIIGSVVMRFSHFRISASSDFSKSCIRFSISSFLSSLKMNSDSWLFKIMITKQYYYLWVNCN